ncbi:MAG: DMT family transporter [Acidobacteria bacterium]|nr:DMT family transporter [Acidobacteriota bacterium]
MTGQARRDHYLGVTFAIVSALGFSGKAIFVKLAYAGAKIDATVLLTLRMLFSAPFFALIAWRASRDASRPPLSRGDWMWLVWLAFVGYYASTYLDFWGLEYISAALERIILFTYPAWVLLISAVWTRQPVRGRDIASLALSFFGIAMSFVNDMRFVGPGPMVWKGSLLVFGASVVYSFYLLGSKHVVLRIGSQRFTAWVVILAGLMMGTQFVLTRPLSQLVHPPRVYWMSLALAVVSTVVPIICVVQALKRISPAMVAVCSTIGPVLTILMASVFLDEPLTMMQVVGALLVLAGVGLISRAPVES